MNYLVSVQQPQHQDSAWITIDPNSGLPVFTFRMPAPMDLSAATYLKTWADIVCGGTLEIVEV